MDDDTGAIRADAEEDAATMHSNNPVLSRADAWQTQSTTAQGQQVPGTAYPQGYPGQQPYGYAGQQPYQPQTHQPAPVAGTMTIDDVITKTAITLGVLMLSAGATFWATLVGIIPLQALTAITIVTGLVAFGTVMLVSFRRKLNPAFVLAYSVIEGVFIGAMSALFEVIYPGIVLPAVLGTFVAAGAVLLAYKAFRIRVTNRFRKMVMIGTMAYAGVLLVNFALSFFGIGFLAVGQFSWIAVLASVFGVGLAVFNLILDFDFIEKGIAMGAPSSESWRGAFGLTVTMVWLYIEILRILSYLRSN